MDNTVLPNSSQTNPDKLSPGAKNGAEQVKVRALLLQKHLIEWFENEQSGMQTAIQQSILGTDFTSSDIYFQLSTIKSRLVAGDLVRWVEKSYGEEDPQVNEPEQNEQEDHEVDSPPYEQTHVLCIHAGNLPLVGLQDALAVLLAGFSYTGKISRKDPYLLVSILKWLVHRGWQAQIQHWSIETVDIPAKNYQKVLFSGSVSSLTTLKNILVKAEIIESQTTWLNRTASFSMAYCPNKEMVKKHASQLIEAVVRHGGKGCRSVGVVVCPVGLSELQNPLEEALKSTLVEAEIEANPDSKLVKQEAKKNKLTSVAYKKAYNLAIDRTFLCVGDWLIEEHSVEQVPEPRSNRVVYWVKADVEVLGSLVERFGLALQSVYYLGADNSSLEGLLNAFSNIESIDYAQRPPLYWKPDGVDVLRYLCPFII